MYAIIETGAKQYKAQVGELLSVEKLEKESGKEVIMDRVLFVSHDTQPTWGNPYIKNAQVICEVVRQTRTPKIIIFKYKRRKSSRKKKGHRQPQTLLKVKAIQLNGEMLAQETEVSEPKRKTQKTKTAQKTTSLKKKTSKKVVKDGA
ncbi:MAG: 50S ribosomal protein L21 [Deltaproteobacteria bacterium]|nr:50S ribosomal protein L21 [Deltaproteobacteria bacterium]